MPTPDPSTPDQRLTGKAIEVHGLRMAYGKLEVLRGVDLEVEAGMVFCLVGPNGAGKTTTIEVLEGYRQRTAGDVSVLGADPSRGGRGLRDRIGILLQDGGVEPYLTVREVVDATRGYYRRPLPAAELLDIVGLSDQAKVRVRRLSAGQRRRLELALALAGDPELVFLDEPTTGFDPHARLAAWDAIRRLTARGTTVVLTTNVMDEAQALADRVAIIVAGRIVAHGTPLDVVGARGPGSAIRFRLPEGGPALPPELTRMIASSRDDVLELRTVEPAALVNTLSAWALQNGLPLHDLVVAPRSLEDAYLELTAAAAASAPGDEVATA